MKKANTLLISTMKVRPANEKKNEGPKEPQGEMRVFFEYFGKAKQNFTRTILFYIETLNATTRSRNSNTQDEVILGTG